MQIVIERYNDFWLDNGLENLYRILKRLPEDVVKEELVATGLYFEILDRERFIPLLQEEILHLLENVIFVEKKNEETGEIRNIKKDFILAQYGSKEDGRNVLKEKIFYPPEINQRLKEIFAEHKKKEKTCILCGQTFGKNVDNLKQLIYPPVTKIASLTGVRRQQENYKDICPICYLIGALEWTDRGMIYRTFNDGFSIVLFPLTANLIDLNRMKERYIETLLNNSDRYCNIKIRPESPEVEKTSGEFSTLLCFYEKFIFYAGIELDLESFLTHELCTEWCGLHIPLGKVWNIRVNRINLKSQILRVILNLAKDDVRLYQSCLKRIVFKKRSKQGLTTDWDITREVVEELSRAFLEDNFPSFARKFLPQKQGFLQISKAVDDILESLIKEWRCSMALGKAAIVPEDLDTIRGAGNIVGKISQNHVNILFKLDRARTPLEFTDALREAARRMFALEEKEYERHTFAPSKLEELISLFKQKESNWEEIRNLLIVYSCVALSKERMRSTDKQPTMEVTA
jgi:hypothetical protein